MYIYCAVSVLCPLSSVPCPCVLVQQQRVGHPASEFKAFSQRRSQPLQLHSCTCTSTHPHMHVQTRTRWLSSLPFINYWFSISINIDCRLNSQFKLSSWVPIQGWHEPWALERLNYTPAPVSHPHPTYHTSTVMDAHKQAHTNTHTRSLFPHLPSLYTSLSVPPRCWYKHKSSTPHRSHQHLHLQTHKHGGEHTQMHLFTFSRSRTHTQTSIHYTFSVKLRGGSIILSPICCVSMSTIWDTGMLFDCAAVCVSVCVCWKKKKKIIALMHC